MRTLPVILVTLGIAAGALAQGKVTLINDNNHMLKYSPYPYRLRPADAALAGTALVSPASPNNTWMMELWAAPSATAREGDLRRLGDSTFPVGAPVAGRFNGWAFTLPSGYPGGPATAPVLATFQIRFWEKTPSNYASYSDALESGLAYTVKTPVFTMNPGPAAANSLVSPLSPSFSTWNAGVLWIGGMPEPASASLIGLGLACLLLFRSNKALSQ